MVSLNMPLGGIGGNLVCNYFPITFTISVCNVCVFSLLTVLQLRSIWVNFVATQSSLSSVTLTGTTTAIINPLPKISTTSCGRDAVSVENILQDEVVTGYFAGEASLLPISQSKSIIGYCLVVSTININVNITLKTHADMYWPLDLNDLLMEVVRVHILVWVVL